jgi:hypothetical protein
MTPKPKSTPRTARRKAGARGPRLKLVKVVVQPHFVIDHGDHADELIHPPIAIPASEWPRYSSERFPRELAAFRKQIAEGKLEQP